MVILALLAAGFLAKPDFAVLHEFKIGGEGGWDLMAVDTKAQRLYISRGTHVQVMATDTGKLVADIQNMKGCHGIALAPSLGKGFITDGRDNTVAVIDLKTDKETARVQTGENPDAIIFDQATNQIFAFNGRSNDATVIDAKTNKVNGTVKFDGKPELPASDGHGHVYVNYEDKSEIAEIDARSLKVTRTWPLAPAEEPTGLAIDVKDGLLFSSCGNGMMAVSSIKSGKVVGTPAIGQGPDSAGFDPGLGLAFSSNGEGTVSILQKVGDAWQPVQTVKTQASARTMVVDPVRHLVYTIAADFDAPKEGQRRGTMKPDSATIIVVGPKK